MMACLRRCVGCNIIMYSMVAVYCREHTHKSGRGNELCSFYFRETGQEISQWYKINVLAVLCCIKTHQEIIFDVMIYGI